MKVLFLDIDGVLNGHQILREAGCCGIDLRCVRHLNYVLKRTEAKIVLTSAWRYIILLSDMTMKGFWYMLMTHGMSNNGNGCPIIGYTQRDEQTGDEHERGEQVRSWLRWWKELPGHLPDRSSKVKRYAAIDDDDLGYTRYCIPFVQTDGKRGMTRRNAMELVRLLS